MKRLPAALLILLTALVAFYTFGPAEDATFDLSFDPAPLDAGLDAYLARQEARLDDITPGTQKRIIWAGAPEVQTEWAVLYVHGFSATSEEIRPVPDRVAAALGANLVFTRLAGHGRGSAALAQPGVQDWTRDMAEALAIAARAGTRTLVIATSTGGTLATAAATRPDITETVAGMVLISPNYQIANPAAALLTWPAARHWVPLVAGPTRSFEPLNAQQDTYWTTRYPTVATLPMAALVKAVNALELRNILIPALFIYARDDQVVRAAATDRVADRWGAGFSTRTRVLNPVMGPGDDPSSHVIAGDILSPGQTAPIVAAILDFAADL